MAPEAMMTVCGLVIRPLRHDQQPGCTQDIEQAIPANLDACLGQGVRSTCWSLRVPKRGWRSRKWLTNAQTLASRALCRVSLCWRL
ncbi:hypothetical protein [Ralstonia pickettii]|uniref:hypothetical protein n=1 Tax=Ralstonia pickettii TaxID=329 RepID=UPI000A4C00F0